MSVPRCVWTSKMSRSPGRSARTRSSQEAAICPARSSASIELNIAVSGSLASRAGCAPILCRVRKGHCRPRSAGDSKEPSSRPPDRRLHEAHLPARPAHSSCPAARCRVGAGERLGQHRRRRGLRRRRQQRRARTPTTTSSSSTAEPVPWRSTAGRCSTRPARARRGSRRPSAGRSRREGGIS